MLQILELEKVWYNFYGSDVMSNQFDFRSWKNSLVYSREDLEKRIKKLDFFNKKIVDIAMIGNDYLLDKAYFVNHYNNANDLSVYDLKKEVSLKDFNDSDTELVHIFTNYPIIIKFETGETLEMLFTLEGKYGISMNKIPFNKKAKEGNNIDISKLFEQIKGRKIVNYRIKDLKPDNGSYIYINQKKLTGTPINTFELILDDDSIMWFCHDALYIMKNEEFERIKLFDYLKCIPNYEEYFSDVSVDRYTEEEKIKGKNHKEPEIDCIKKLAKTIRYDQGKMIDLLTYLFNNKESVVKNMDKFIDAIKNEYHDNQPSIEEFDNLIHKTFDKK